MVPSLADSLITVIGFVLLAIYTFCSDESTESHLTVGSNANEVSQICESDESIFLTTVFPADNTIRKFVLGM